MANLFEEATPADVAFEEMLACVDRELKMRAQVYPRWVQQNKLTQEAADRQMLAMRAVRFRLIASQAMKMALDSYGVMVERKVLFEVAGGKQRELQRLYPEPQL